MPGNDLIAYLDLDQAGRFIACPIQMKAATSESFSLFQKYQPIAQLLLVYVWHIDNAADACAFALRYDEAKAIATEMGRTKNASWDQGRYSTTGPSRRLRTLLAPFLMREGDWRRRVEEMGLEHGSRAEPNSSMNR